MFSNAHPRSLARLRFAAVFAAAALIITSIPAQADVPVVVYQKTFSEFGYLQPQDIVVDDQGDAFVLAARYGNDYATLVLKLDPNGDVIWSKWFDGSSHDIPGGIAIDPAGDVYVVGTTGSTDFPTLNPLQANLASAQYDAFVVKMSGVDGTQLYGTYLGASRSEFGNDIAVNDAGEMYITGSTQSLDFPVVNAIQSGLNGYPYYGWTDAYVAKISADGSQLLYSTFYGGYYGDTGQGIALDGNGRIYIVGETDSDDFPVVNAAQANSGGDRDGFAARFSADGQTVEYSTYVGGEDIESVRDLALGADNRLFMIGSTESIALPTTPGAYQENFVGAIAGCEVPFGAIYNCDDVFVACVAPDGRSFDYATYLGGDQIDYGYSIDVDSAGRAYATGHTRSDDFPPYASGTFYTNFVTRFDAGGGNIAYSFLHPTVTPSPAYLTLDNNRNIYVVATNDTPTILTVFKLSQGGVASDFDGDGCVGLSDLSLLLSEYGCSAGCATDLDGDGDVDLSDLSMLLSEYGVGCP